MSIRPCKDECGYTLVELLAVGTVMLILASVVVPALSGTIDRTKVNTARNTLVMMRSALNRKYASAANASANGQYPVATAPIADEDAFTLAIGQAYWSRPGSPNYTFVWYVTDAAGSQFTLCIRAFDSKAAGANGGPGTLMRINARGTLAEDSPGGQSSPTVFCALQNE